MNNKVDLSMVTGSGCGPNTVEIFDCHEAAILDVERTESFVSFSTGAWQMREADSSADSASPPSANASCSGKMMLLTYHEYHVLSSLHHRNTYDHSQ